VLDGGLFTGARLVELAEAVLGRERAGDGHSGAGSEPGELRELHAAGEATRA